MGGARISCQYAATASLMPGHTPRQDDLSRLVNAVVMWRSSCLSFLILVTHTNVFSSLLGFISLLHFEVGACIHGRRPHILPVCCNGFTLAWTHSVFSLRFQLLTASVFHAFSGFSFVKCNFAGSAFFLVSVTALFSVNCSSGCKFLQVFCLHSCQDLVK